MNCSFKIYEKDGVEVLSVVGKFDYGVYFKFQRALDEVCDDPDRGLVLDLSGVDYIDTSALGLIMQYNNQGKKLVLVQNVTVSAILALTRLASIFVAKDTLDEALAVINQR